MKNELIDKMKIEFDDKMKNIDTKITNIAENLAKAIVDKENNEKKINLAESIIENKLDTKFKELDDILDKMREDYTVKETQDKKNIIIEEDKINNEEAKLKNLNIYNNECDDFGLIIKNFKIKYLSNFIIKIYYKYFTR